MEWSDSAKRGHWMNRVHHETPMERPHSHGPTPLQRGRIPSGSGGQSTGSPGQGRRGSGGHGGSTGPGGRGNDNQVSRR